MRILFVHNFYGSEAPSGENRVFEAEVQMMIKYGHEVKLFIRRSDEIRNKGIFGLLKGAFTTPWNFFSIYQMRKMINFFKPDIVHVHNTFPLISPSVFYAIGNAPASILTLHNYRLFCAAALPFRNGHICTECIDKKNTFPSLYHACYRGSRLATFPLAFNISLHRMMGTWKNKVDSFIVFSEFQKKMMIQAGIPDSLLHIKANFYPLVPPVIPWGERERYIVFVGRLTSEKGVLTLVRAWQLWGTDAPELHIIGDGELRPMLESMSEGLPVKFFGQLGSSDTHSKIARAQLLILPSECFEGSPMALIEAFAHGTPVAVSGIGPLPSLLNHGECGPIFRYANPESIVEVISSVWAKPEMLESFGRSARNEFDLHYTEEFNHKTLLTIYENAILLNSNKLLKK